MDKEIKFQIITIRPIEDGYNINRLTNVSGQDLTDIIEAATRDENVYVGIKREEGARE